MDLGGGGGAQPRAPLGRSSVQGPRGAALYVLLTDQVCLWILRRRALATWATWRLQRCSNAANAVTARVAATMLARNGRKGARIASALFAGSVCKAPQMRHARLRLCLRQASRTHTHTHTHARAFSLSLSCGSPPRERERERKREEREERERKREREGPAVSHYAPSLYSLSFLRRERKRE
jgi:hypothetical protein